MQTHLVSQILRQDMAANYGHISYGKKVLLCVPGFVMVFSVILLLLVYFKGESVWPQVILKWRAMNP